jgi:hypothetical protein
LLNQPNISDGNPKNERNSKAKVAVPNPIMLYMMLKRELNPREAEDIEIFQLYLHRLSSNRLAK